MRLRPRRLRGLRDRGRSTTWIERSEAPAHGRLETAHGPVHVDLSGATWASARRAITAGPGARTSGHRSTTSWSETQADGTLRESTEAGDAVLAVGRATLDDRGYTLGAGRRDPVLLFSSPPGTSPRRVLARAVRDHYLGVAALVVLGGLGLWIAVSPLRGERLDVWARLLAELPM